ncbi:MAG: ATP-binding protein [Verrucomicrobiota bacterium]|jgi:predicted HTH transcriptional regulator
MLLADKEFKNIAQTDLKSLKENRIPESREIEYKQALEFDSPDGKRKFLKQISSFANSSGGHLIYGVREDKGIPVELCGLDLSDQDKEIQRIENLVRDGHSRPADQDV